jgi:hypothetical protein
VSSEPVADVVLARMEEHTMQSSELLREVAARRTDARDRELQRRAAASLQPSAHSAPAVCVPTPLHLRTPCS